MDCYTRDLPIQLLSAGDIYFNGFGRGDNQATDPETARQIVSLFTKNLTGRFTQSIP
jgi:hypothetical protein